MVQLQHVFAVLQSSACGAEVQLLCTSAICILEQRHGAARVWRGECRIVSTL